MRLVESGENSKFVGYQKCMLKHYYQIICTRLAFWSWYVDAAICLTFWNL